MKVAVFGLGYVGCVTAACFAKQGHEVVGVDVTTAKVDLVNRGVPTVNEPGLAEIMAEAVAAGLLSATSSVADAVARSDVAMICVGTPSRANGSLDTEFVERVCKDLASALVAHDGEYLVVVRSTVLPGTTGHRVAPHFAESSNVSVATNPEFLREGTAVRDFYEPGVIVIGADDPTVGTRVAELYAGIDAEVVSVPIATSELVKYSNNAFHALKITFANEIGAIAKAHGVDGREVMEIVIKDTRLNISPAYLRPGFAFGGSCLPKDMRALLHRASELTVRVPMLSGVIQSNEQQVSRAVQLVENTGAKRIGILGLAFKPGTDDVRESPSVPLIETLIGRGFTVLVHDDHVVPEQLFGANRAYVERELPHIASILRSDLECVLHECDAVIVANGSKAYHGLTTRLKADQFLIDLVGSVQPNGPSPVTGLFW